MRFSMSFFLQGRYVVDMPRREASTLDKQHFHPEQHEGDSQKHYGYKHKFHRSPLKICCKYRKVRLNFRHM